MNDQREPFASTTIIEGVQANDDASRTRLFLLSKPFLTRWFRTFGAEKNASELVRMELDDLIHEVFVKVVENVHKFSRDREGATFEGWVWTIARNHFNDRLRKHSPATGGTTNLQRMDGVPDAPPKPPPRELQGRVTIVVQGVREHVKATSYEVFMRIVVNGERAVDVAEDLGMKPSAVREAKRAVLQRVRNEWRVLFGAWPSEDFGTGA